MNLDWHRLKAVVLESDDWGLCAWSADEQAWRVLSDAPAFRGPLARRYAGSTLESRDDLAAVLEILREFRGGDGFPPVWQANTVVAAPDYARLRAPEFACGTLPIVTAPDAPSRWRRPGLWEAVRAACEEGLWWPELHGLHHVPEQAWLAALRRGADDARRAFDQESFVCAAVEASGEHDPEEPAADRTRRLEEAVASFTTLFGRAPTSFCAPDYRWDEHTEADLARLGIVTLQGRGEQHGGRLPRLRREWLRRTWPGDTEPRFEMPPRIAFEPQARGPQRARLGGEAALRAVRAAWGGGRPAVISTHRANYVHLDPAAAQAGRTALRELLRALALEGAVFMVDDEVRQLARRRWSVRPIGGRGALVRYFDVPLEPVRFPAAPGAQGVAMAAAHGPGSADVRIEGGEVVARLQVGEYLLEWSGAGNTAAAETR